MSSSFDRVHVVLLRPRWASNLGAVARVMKNFGIQRLTLVDPRIGSWADAWRNAVKAGDVLQGAMQTSELGAALADAEWIVGTTDDPPRGVQVLTPREVAHEARRRGGVTMLFGGEISGLDPAELLRCHATARIPTAPEQSSLNLAQAVGVFAAELFVAMADSPQRIPPAGSADAPATAEMLQRLELALRHLLENSPWQDASRPKNAIAQLMQPFYRAGLSDSEVRQWLVALGKAGRRPQPPDAESRT